MFRTIDDTMLVAGQIAPADVAEAGAQGVTLIVNNRPDAEEAGQPAGAEIAAAAEAAGIAYVAIPVDHGGLRPDQVAAMGEALAMNLGGRTLAFCRSGTRSTFLWALARGAAGDDADAVAAKAANAGYDVSPLVPTIRALAAQ